MNYFSETIWIGNIEEAAKRIQEMLTDKEYVFTAHNQSHIHTAPRVRPNQKLKNGMVDGSNMIVSIEDGMGHVSFSDTYGSWGFSTSQDKPGYDDTYRAPFVFISEQEGKIEIFQLNGFRDILVWVIQVQE